jgi:hypothetical protein
VTRYLADPRSASAFLRSPLYRGLLDLQVGKGLRFNREPIGKAVALGLPSFVVRGAELSDRRRAQSDDPDSTRLGDAASKGARASRADLARRAPERQLLQEDETNRCGTISVRFGLKMTRFGHSFGRSVHRLELQPLTEQPFSESFAA